MITIVLAGKAVKDALEETNAFKEMPPWEKQTRRGLTSRKRRRSPAMNTQYCTKMRT